MKKANRIDEKWGEKALLLGWTSIPTALLFLQSQKRISPTTFCVLINLISHWWKVKEWPNPSIESLASRIGVTDRTIQRSLLELERKGLLERIKTKESSKYQGRNLYDLSGLVSYLNEEGPEIATLVKAKTSPRVFISHKAKHQ